MSSPSPSPVPHDTIRASSLTTAPAQDDTVPHAAALGPIPVPVSAAGTAARPMVPTDTPAAALGRRTLSTAFVRVGPDGHLTVELHDGRLLVLRDVEMGPTKYCGVLVGAGRGGKRHCGRYADVAAARAGGVPVADAPNLETGARATPTP